MTMNSKFYLLSLLLAFLNIFCGRPDEGAQSEPTSVDAEKTDQDEAENLRNVTPQEAALPSPVIDPLNPENSLPIADSFLPPPISDFPYVPSLGGLGGGGGAKRVRLGLPCEGGTSDCNDLNPCTLDSCNESDVCVHVLDPEKNAPGSCEVDGNGCTVGKCVLVDAAVLCHEEPRAFFAAPSGCNDGNDCTSDSCVRTPLAKAISGEQFDEQGNIILDEEPQCVNEIVNGLACFVDDQCTFGICTETGTGEPNDEFQIACVETGDSAPQAFCPRPIDADPCQISVCTVGVGCELVNAPDESACDDSSSCTEGDVCASGVCVGTPLVCASDGDPCTVESCDATLGCLYAAGNNGAACNDNNACTTNEACSGGVCLSGTDIDCDDNNICTEDFCAAIGGCFHTNLNGPIGNSCQVTTEGVFGICLNGYTQCDSGVEMTDMCVQIFRAGDKEELCENDLDDDCDGEVDEAICACPAIPPGNNVFYVSPTGNDLNDCSEASPCATIQNAHDIASSGDALVLTAGTFTESSITITKDLYIVGQGASLTIIDGGGSGVFVVQPGVSLIICGVTVQNAENGLFNNGTTQVFNSAFIDSNALFGAGLINTGTGNLTVASTTISGNNAQATGGGILNAGVASLISSTVENNSAGDTLGGAGQGGGISNIFATMTITNSIIRNNDAEGPSAVNVQGGGIYNNGTLDIFTSTVDSNSAADGAGIFNATDANIDITDTTISNNSVSFPTGTGGGLRNASNAIMTLNGSTVNNNSAADGAGIYQLGSLTITNSTISTNTATSEGGGIYNFNNTVSLSTTTINNNTATSGASIFLNLGTVTATHTIVANPIGATNCNAATVVDSGFNFDDDGSCGITTSASLNLGALQDNGGPTFTHALVDPSDAIDAGDTSCGVTIDQRGEPRPVDFGTADPNALCDIGAFELQN